MIQHDAAPRIEKDLHVQIVRFLVEPGQADDLIGTIRAHIDEWIRHCDGFVSTTFHKSSDGAHVVNYAQWRDRDAFERFRTHPRNSDLIDDIASVEPKRAAANGFEVLFSVTAP